MGTLMTHFATLLWIDGIQKIADGLTKLGEDKTCLHRVLHALSGLLYRIRRLPR